MGMHVDELLTEYSEKIVSCGPRAGAKFGDVDIAYLKGGGLKSNDKELKAFAKAQTAITELSDSKLQNELAPLSEPETATPVAEQHAVARQLALAPMGAFVPLKTRVKQGPSTGVSTQWAQLASAFGDET